MKDVPTVTVYIDGFNLYKGRLQRDFPKYKWLDIQRLCEAVLPGYDIVQVRYFTAELIPKPHDPNIHMRQRIYLEALSSLPKVSLHYGQFFSRRQYFAAHPLELDPITLKERVVRVHRYEEKGTDVSLATWMMRDAALGLSEYFVLMSLDSDFFEVLNVLKADLGKMTGVIFPSENISGKLLEADPDLVRHVREGALKSSQFSDRVQINPSRKITKPREWC